MICSKCGVQMRLCYKKFNRQLGYDYYYMCPLCSERVMKQTNVVIESSEENLTRKD